MGVGGLPRTRFHLQRGSFLKAPHPHCAAALSHRLPPTAGGRVREGGTGTLTLCAAVALRRAEPPVWQATLCLVVCPQCSSRRDNFEDPGFSSSMAPRLWLGAQLANDNQALMPLTLDPRRWCQAHLLHRDDGDPQDT